MRKLWKCSDKKTKNYKLRLYGIKLRVKYKTYWIIKTLIHTKNYDF